MLVAVICRDRPDAFALRMAHREAHLDHITSSEVVAMAGPFLDEAGTMNGSLVILSVPTMADAVAWAEADPYALAGLFDSVELSEWKRTIG